MPNIPCKPFLSGDWKTIVAKDRTFSPELECGQVVDHCFFQDPAGRWQAWVQIRDTAMGRVFTRWEAPEGFADFPWEFRGVCWKADHEAGESVGTAPEKDVIQAPYVLNDRTGYLLVYGGGPVDPDDVTRQVCMAHSADAVTFVRVRDAFGRSRIAVGPRHAADSFLIRHSGEYYLFVGTAGFETDGARAAVTLRRSRDLCNWSEPVVVHAGGTCGTHEYSSQSVFVCRRDGFFYLFKMGWSGENRTAVYCSDDPADFGRGDEKLVAVLEASACEIIDCDGKWYLSSLILPDYSGVKVAPLEWEETR